MTARQLELLARASTDAVDLGRNRMGLPDAYETSPNRAAEGPTGDAIPAGYNQVCRALHPEGSRDASTGTWIVVCDVPGFSVD